MENKSMWGGRFSQSPHELLQKLSQSIQFDARLYRVDILGSKAHAKALERVGILDSKELNKVLAALDEILSDIEAGKISFSAEYEDIHMNIEKVLTDRIGDLGKKIHTGRSRNDQVITDLRLYIKEETSLIIGLIKDIQRVLLDLAQKYIDVIMPGFTHLQIAQPVLFSHHMLAYFEMFERDRQRFAEGLSRTDVLALGSAALAGSTFGQDREFIARELGFSSLSANSMDAVSDRDFIVELLSAASILMMHLSRFAEEVILWMSPGYNFVNIADEFTTGSSIMPQKRNPDVAELTRGKTGRVYGDLIAVLTQMKGLPLTYNRDLQEDKEPVFDAIDTMHLVLPVFTAMIASLSVNRDVLYEQAHHGFSMATDLADYLAGNNVPFRDAHHVVGNIVKYCETNQKKLTDLSSEEIKGFLPSGVSLPDDLSQFFSPRSGIEARNIYGGTATDQVRNRISAGENLLSRL